MISPISWFTVLMVFSLLSGCVGSLKGTREVRLAALSHRGSVHDSRLTSHMTDDNVLLVDDGNGKLQHIIMSGQHRRRRHMLETAVAAAVTTSPSAADDVSRQTPQSYWSYLVSLFRYDPAETVSVTSANVPLKVISTTVKRQGMTTSKINFENRWTTLIPSTVTKLYIDDSGHSAMKPGSVRDQKVKVKVDQPALNQTTTDNPTTHADGSKDAAPTTAFSSTSSQSITMGALDDQPAVNQTTTDNPTTHVNDVTTVDGSEDEATSPSPSLKSSKTMGALDDQPASKHATNDPPTTHVDGVTTVGGSEDAATSPSPSLTLSITMGALDDQPASKHTTCTSDISTTHVDDSEDAATTAASSSTLSITMGASNDQQTHTLSETSSGHQQEMTTPTMSVTLERDSEKLARISAISNRLTTGIMVHSGTNAMEKTTTSPASQFKQPHSKSTKHSRVLDEAGVAPAGELDRTTDNMAHTKSIYPDGLSTPNLKTETTWNGSIYSTKTSTHTSTSTSSMMPSLTQPIATNPAFATITPNKPQTTTELLTSIPPSTTTVTSSQNTHTFIPTMSSGNIPPITSSIIPSISKLTKSPMSTKTLENTPTMTAMITRITSTATLPSSHSTTTNKATSTRTMRSHVAEPTTQVSSNKAPSTWSSNLSSYTTFFTGNTTKKSTSSATQQAETSTAYHSQSTTYQDTSVSRVDPSESGLTSSTSRMSPGYIEPDSITHPPTSMAILNSPNPSQQSSTTSVPTVTPLTTTPPPSSTSTTTATLTSTSTIILTDLSDHTKIELPSIDTTSLSWLQSDYIEPPEEESDAVVKVTENELNHEYTVNNEKEIITLSNLIPAKSDTHQIHDGLTSAGIDMKTAGLVTETPSLTSASYEVNDNVSIQVPVTNLNLGSSTVSDVREAGETTTNDISKTDVPETKFSSSLGWLPFHRSSTESSTSVVSTTHSLKPDDYLRPTTDDDSEVALSKPATRGRYTTSSVKSDAYTTSSVKSDAYTTSSVKSDAYTTSSVKSDAYTTSSELMPTRITQAGGLVTTITPTSRSMVRSMPTPTITQTVTPSIPETKPVNQRQNTNSTATESSSPSSTSLSWLPFHQSDNLEQADVVANFYTTSDSSPTTKQSTSDVASAEANRTDLTSILTVDRKYETTTTAETHKQTHNTYVDETTKQKNDETTNYSSLSWLPFHRTDLSSAAVERLSTTNTLTSHTLGEQEKEDEINSAIVTTGNKSDTVFTTTSELPTSGLSKSLAQSNQIGSELAVTAMRAQHSVANSQTVSYGIDETTTKTPFRTDMFSTIDLMSTKRHSTPTEANTNSIEQQSQSLLTTEKTARSGHFSQLWNWVRSWFSTKPERVNSAGYVSSDMTIDADSSTTESSTQIGINSLEHSSSISTEADADAPTTLQPAYHSQTEGESENNPNSQMLTSSPMINLSEIIASSRSSKTITTPMSELNTDINLADTSADSVADSQTTDLTGRVTTMGVHEAIWTDTDTFTSTSASSVVAREKDITQPVLFEQHRSSTNLLPSVGLATKISPVTSSANKAVTGAVETSTTFNPTSVAHVTSVYPIEQTTSSILMSSRLDEPELRKTGRPSTDATTDIFSWSSSLLTSTEPSSATKTSVKLDTSSTQAVTMGDAAERTSRGLETTDVTIQVFHEVTSSSSSVQSTLELSTPSPTESSITADRSPSISTTTKSLWTQPQKIEETSDDSVEQSSPSNEIHSLSGSSTDPTVGGSSTSSRSSREINSDISTTSQVSSTTTPCDLENEMDRSSMTAVFPTTSHMLLEGQTTEVQQKELALFTERLTSAQKQPAADENKDVIAMTSMRLEPSSTKQTSETTGTRNLDTYTKTSARQPESVSPRLLSTVPSQLTTMDNRLGNTESGTTSASTTGSDNSRSTTTGTLVTSGNILLSDPPDPGLTVELSNDPPATEHQTMEVTSWKPELRVVQADQFDTTSSADKLTSLEVTEIPNNTQDVVETLSFTHITNEVSGAWLPSLSMREISEKSTGTLPVDYQTTTRELNIDSRSSDVLSGSTKAVTDEVDSKLVTAIQTELSLLSEITTSSDSSEFSIVTESRNNNALSTEESSPQLQTTTTGSSELSTPSTTHIIPMTERTSTNHMDESSADLNVDKTVAPLTDLVTPPALTTNFHATNTHSAHEQQNTTITSGQTATSEPLRMYDEAISPRSNLTKEPSTNAATVTTLKSISTMVTATTMRELTKEEDATLTQHMPSEFLNARHETTSSADFPVTMLSRTTPHSIETDTTTVALKNDVTDKTIGGTEVASKHSNQTTWLTESKDATSRSASELTTTTQGNTYLGNTREDDLKLTDTLPTIPSIEQIATTQTTRSSGEMTTEQAEKASTKSSLELSTILTTSKHDKAPPRYTAGASLGMSTKVSTSRTKENSVTTAPNMVTMVTKSNQKFATEIPHPNQNPSLTTIHTKSSSTKSTIRPAQKTTKSAATSRTLNPKVVTLIPTAPVTQSTTTITTPLVHTKEPATKPGTTKHQHTSLNATSKPIEAPITMNFPAVETESTLPPVKVSTHSPVTVGMTSTSTTQPSKHESDRKPTEWEDKSANDSGESTGRDLMDKMVEEKKADSTDNLNMTTLLSVSVVVAGLIIITVLVVVAVICTRNARRNSEIRNRREGRADWESSYPAPVQPPSRSSSNNSSSNRSNRSKFAHIETVSVKAEENIYSEIDETVAAQLAVPAAAVANHPVVPLAPSLAPRALQVINPALGTSVSVLPSTAQANAVHMAQDLIVPESAQVVDEELYSIPVPSYKPPALPPPISPPTTPPQLPPRRSLPALPGVRLLGASGYNRGVASVFNLPYRSAAPDGQITPISSCSSSASSANSSPDRSPQSTRPVRVLSPGTLTDTQPTFSVPASKSRVDTRPTTPPELPVKTKPKTQSTSKP